MCLTAAKGFMYIKNGTSKDGASDQKDLGFDSVPHG
tara:strand:+ start:1348 stop:1455 length:108 start_codon:yes stop_codon:yes gene_type:complete